MTGCQRRQVSLSSSKLPLCHGRGREFESRRPRHFFSISYEKRMAPAVGCRDFWPTRPKRDPGKTKGSGRFRSNTLTILEGCYA